MNWILNAFITYILFTSTEAQQNYSGNLVMSCNSSDETAPSEIFLYSCNGEYRCCRAFLSFTARYPYNLVPTIATLTSANQDVIAQVNNITRLTDFPTDERVMVPAHCSCLGEYCLANTTYHIPTAYETYFTIANNTYQGLSTCDALKTANSYSEFDLQSGMDVRVPLRCACPTRGQTADGSKYLLTYSVGWYDTIPSLSVIFNVSVKKLHEANGFSENPTLYPFTTILIPLHSEPLSSHSTTEDYNSTMSPVPGFGARKSRSNRVISTAGIVAGGLSLLLVLILIVIFLVFEYMKNGSLREWLGTEGSKDAKLEAQDPDCTRQCQWTPLSPQLCPTSLCPQPH